MGKLRKEAASGEKLVALLETEG